MAFQTKFLGGCACGALGMYLLDPQRGAYRRALLRDKGIHYQKVIRKKVGVVGRDISHRSTGVAATVKRRLKPEKVSDDVLVARVASKLGRIVSNPHSLELTAENGRVIVSGPIFSDEAEHLIRALRFIPGVRGIENHLEIHGRHERHPALQGHRRLKGPTMDLFQSRWSPATRFFVTVTGGLLALTTGLAVRKAG